VFGVVGHEPLIDVALALEQTALTDKFFVDRKLYPNGVLQPKVPVMCFGHSLTFVAFSVDFYSGLIYRAGNFPVDFFPVLFAIPRVAGW
jgi:citrate synthase